MNVLLPVAVALRLLNPHDVAVEATLHCGGEARVVRLEAHELRDVEACRSAEALVPVAAVRMFVDEEQREWQQPATLDLCGAQPPAMNVPSFACRNGVATAYVAPVAGATYAWSADGAAIAAGAATNFASVQFGDAPTATLSCVISTPECTQTATGIIAVREPIAVRSFSVPAETNANRPLTIAWSYTPGTEPAAQILMGDLFPEPVTLDPGARSYTVTPETAGTRTVELRASYAATVTKRRRRAMGGGVSASECPAATATARVDVKGCISSEPVVQVPEDVAAGETFEAKVADLAEGDEVDWSADNGTIQSVAGRRALVAAGASGKTVVHARVQRGPGCFATASASVAIIRPLNGCALPPSAALSLVSESCNRAIVRATFTGTPPFAGRWSDGKTFRATGRSVDHEFIAPGTYGMTLFHDGSCFGTVSGSPSAAMKKPTVKLASVSGCGGGEVTATFTGTPPFQGTWSDGQPFTSATTTLTRTVPAGTWSVRDVTDATCPIKTSSNAVTVAPAPRASLQPATVCYIPADSYFFPPSFQLETTGGQPPYVYEFTDGYVFTTSSPSISLSRPSASDVQRWELERVTANGCEVTLDNRATTIYRRTGVQLDGTAITACTLTNLEIASIWQPSPGGRIEWNVSGVSFTDEDPEIVGDDTGPKITIRATHPTYAEVSVRTRWEGFCRYDLSPRVRVRFVKCD
jgi:hypothetical protein